MRIFRRPAVWKHNAKYAMEVSKQSIRNYQKLFDVPFPFSKLDQVMAPDMKYGGMENAGCIVYAENQTC